MTTPHPSAPLFCPVCGSDELKGIDPGVGAVGCEHCGAIGYYDGLLTDELHAIHLRQRRRRVVHGLAKMVAGAIELLDDSFSGLAIAKHQRDELEGTSLTGHDDVDDPA